MTKLERFRQRLTSETALQQVLTRSISIAACDLPGKTLPFRRFYNNDDSATIHSCDDSALTPEFDFKALAAVSDEEFKLPFYVIAPVTLYFYIGKADYYNIEDDAFRPAVSDHNDEVYEAELETEIIVNGFLTIYLDAETPITEPELIDEDSVEVVIGSIEDAKEEF